MNEVAHAIATLLYDHETVIVPGMGAFVCHAEGAKVNVITNQFEKPTATLEFDPQRREENSLLADCLAVQEGISDDEARKLVLTFVSDSYTQLMSGGVVEIPEVGRLAFNDHQEMVFTPVEANDFNGDAFGLADIHPNAVYNPENQNDWKQQVSQQIKDLNTAMTVDIKHDDGGGKRRGWIWPLILLLVAGGVVLWYFKFRPTTLPSPIEPALIDTLKPVETDSVPVMDTLPIMDTLALPVDTMAMDTVAIPEDTVVEPTIQETPKTPETPVTPMKSIEAKAFIIGGCFSIEQNALNMVDETKAMGCADAFVMKRGSMFYVCYGSFATSADAKQQLPEVQDKYNRQAWILTR